MSICSSLNRHRFRKFHLSLLCVLLVFLATGCGGGGSPEQSTSEKTTAASTDTGSASFAIQWHAASAEPASAADSAVVRQAIENCETAGVASITCSVYDGSQNVIAEGGPWDCSAHQGSIDAIPIGSNRTFSVLGWNGLDGDGDAVYQGKATGVTINAGLNVVGTIDARPFVPDAPTMGEVYGNQINLSWNDIGVSGYRIYRDGAVVGDSTSASYSDTGLTPLTTYCYTISARDSYNNESAQSGQTCIATSNEGSNIYYRDADNDNYGNPDDATQAATAPDGYVADNSDCDDGNADRYPGNTEICGDNIDQDCSGADLSCSDVDNDGDGFTENQGDCNDQNANINPDAAEVCNGIDDNCAGGIDEGLSTDADGDGHYTTSSCLTPHDDCDDGNANRYPGNTEICGDNIDQDCSGADLSCDNVDNDGDGFTENQGDCNDQNASINPNAAEVCNGIDDNCAGGIDEGLSTDADGDGHYTTSSCLTPHDDCDDGNANINPDAAEVCNGIDDNCAGGIDENLTRPTTCGVGACTGNTGTEICSAGVWGGNTCDPTAGAGAEVCDNVDNDCDGSVDENLTRPTTCGVGACAGNTGNETCSDGVWGGDTCDPTAGASREVCDDVDNDCDGEIDENLRFRDYYADADDDSYGNPNDVINECLQPTGYITDNTDCNDDDPDINPGAREVCYDGIDNNCDGVRDNNCDDINPTSSFTARLIGNENVLVADANDKEGQPFNSTFLSIKEGTSDRVCLEFNITSRPLPRRVTLEFNMSNMDDPAYSTITLYGYLGNGLANAADYFNNDSNLTLVRIGSFTDGGASGTNPYSIDVTDAYLTTIKMEGTYMGILMKADDTVARYSVYSPVLTLTY